MPFRAIATELVDQHEIERARLAEMLDDRLLVIERAMRALRENRIEDIQLDPNGYNDALLALGGLMTIRRTLTLTRSIASRTTNPAVRAALV